MQAIVKKWDFLGFTQRARVGARGVRGARGSSRLTSREAARTVWALSLRRKGIMSSYRSTFTSMSCVPLSGLAQFCRPPAARGKAWRGVARKELREEGRGEGREERVRLLQLERVELPTPSSIVPSLGCTRVASGGLGGAQVASGALGWPQVGSNDQASPQSHPPSTLWSAFRGGKAERGGG